MGFLNEKNLAKPENIEDIAKNSTNQAIEMKTESGDKNFKMEVVEPDWRLEELILPDETKEAIQQAANTILASPTVEAWLGDQDKMGHRIAVNFYGPPGTGKTCSADALATLLSLKMIKVNYAEMESSLVGKTAKNVRQAFQQAEKANALLFFDEADSILSRRFTNLSQASEAHINQTRSTMMTELQKFQGVVVFATNLQQNYDDAFVRRIAAHVRFSLPNEKLRLNLWQMYMPETLPRANDIDIDKLTQLSEGFSPADIATAVRQAAVMAAIRNEDKKRVFLADLEKAIDRIKNAQHEVGTRRQNSEENISRRMIQASELPDEIKAQ
jgi:SpoVK/Ycf46/Vps4 family AAA+-type ATPase